METQVTLIEATGDLLYLNPLFFVGFIIIGVILFYLFRKNQQLPKVKITIVSFLFYYYLCLTFENIVGIPTLSEFNRLANLGEPIFNPNISLVPFTDGASLGFILNIFLFIPLGFFCPLLAKKYEGFKWTFLVGFGLSLFIEISQIFTLYRATDIDDLITNVIGAIIGYLCFKVAVKIKAIKLHSKLEISKINNILPILILFIAFSTTFLVG